jgi:NADH dehydrogenase/NADH:ubiquinone oxidoreductase subunit G
MAAGQFVRLTESERTAITIYLDGEPLAALQGDTVLTALLNHDHKVRLSEFGNGPRAGFCLTGACQDCWVSEESGKRLRACTTMARESMRLMSGAAPA